MDGEAFGKVLGRRQALMTHGLGVKAAEYASEADRLRHFELAAALLGGNAAEAAWAFCAKHLVSIGEMVHDPQAYSRHAWDEKLGDAINYLVLIEAIVEGGRRQREAGASVNEANP